MPKHTAVTCIKTNLETILPIRHRVLRPGLPRSSARFTGDQQTAARHWAAFTGKARTRIAVGCLSLYPEPSTGALPIPETSRANQWRLRGMAILPTWQHQGIGSRLLRASLAELPHQADCATLVWCNAREAAVAFYQKNGFTIHGERFEIPEVGPHFFMYRTI